MRLSKLAVPLVLIYLSLLVVACASSPKFIINKNDRDKLSQIPGKIELVYPDIGPDGGKISYYSIVKGELSLNRVEKAPPYLSQHPRILFQDIPKEWPKITGYIYFGPYCISPNKLYIATSLSSDRNLVTDFAIIRLDDKKVVFQTKNKEVQYVDDIAWSFDSSKVALLNHSSNRKAYPADIFFSIMAHPIVYRTYFLSIYDLNGNLLVKTKVASDVAGGSIQIDWTE